MLYSMTGFGRCLVEDAHYVQQWEIKSVNSRHLDLKWRLPLLARGLESRFEKVVRRAAQRGRVEISLTLSRTAGAPAKAAFDAAQASALLDALAALAVSRNEVFAPDHCALLHIHGLWSDMSVDVEDDLTGRLEEGLRLALEDWNESRAAEGHALAADIHTRILRMEEWTDILHKRAPDIKEERLALARERLVEALAQHTDAGLDENRFLQEFVILSDKADVSEELTRLNAHLARLRELLQVGGDAGRRLDFTLQECFREINTCGNKIPDVQLSRLVVDYKNELEKCREQAQNME